MTAWTRMLCGPAWQPDGRLPARRIRQIDALLAEYGQSALVITPDQSWADAHLKRMLLGEGVSTPGVWDTPAMTFGRFAERLLAGEGSSGRSINEMERRLLLYRSAWNSRNADAPAPPRPPMPPAELDGFASQIARAINELKQAAVLPEAFRDGCRRRKHASALDHDVACVYEQYQGLLHHYNLFDQIGYYWSAREICDRQRPVALDGIKLLIFDGFDDFTESEFRLVEALARHVEGIVFGIDYDTTPDRQDLFRLQSQTIDKLVKALGAEVRHDEVAPPVTWQAHAAHYFLWRGEHPQPPDSKPSLRIVPCLSMMAEIETAARQIKSLLLDGVPSEEIVLACPDPRSVAAMATAVFESMGMPLQVFGPAPLSESGACAFVLSALEATIDWRRDETAALLASPWFWLGGRRPPLEVDAIPALAVLAGITKGAESWENGLSRLRQALDSSSGADACDSTEQTPGEVDGEEDGEDDDARSRPEEDILSLASRLRRIPRVREAVTAMQERFDALRNASASFAEPATLATHAWRADRLVEACGVPFAAVNNQNVPIRDAETAALGVLRDLLGAIDLWLDNVTEPVAWRAFLGLLRRFMRLCSYPRPRIGAGVHCLPMARLRNQRFDHVFLTGMNEGAVPRAQAVNAVYGKDDADDLREAGICLPDRASHWEREIQRFRHALASARQTMLITWSIFSRDGREGRKSPFLADIAELFSESGIEDDTPPADAFVPPVNEIASVTDLRNAAVLRNPRLRDAMPEVFADIDPAMVVEAARHNSTPFGPYDGVLADQDVIDCLARRYGEKHIFSVSQLEQYITCPFQFFLRNVLKIPRPETPQDMLTRLDTGTLAHEAMRLFCERFPRQAIAEVEETRANNAMEEIVDTLFAARVARAAPVMKAVLNAECAHLKWRLLQHLRRERESGDITWKPFRFEARFGRPVRSGHHEDTAAPIIIMTPAGPLLFQGVIDRLDEREASVRIIDYKTGKPPSAAKVKNGESIQLAVYFAAAEERFSDGRPCIEARFVELGAKATKKPHLAYGGGKEDIKDILNAAWKVCAETITNMRSGQFAPVPQKDVCGFCGAIRLCRYSEARVERKLRHEALVSQDVNAS